MVGVGGMKLLAAVALLWAFLPWGGPMAAAPKEVRVAGAKTMEAIRPAAPKGVVAKLPADRVAQILLARLRRVEQREAELEQREKNLQMLKQEIEERIRELKRLQKGLEGEVSKAQSREEARFQHLVGVYSAMQPQRAAALLDKLDDRTVVKIFAMMKSRKVAAIMALMDPDKAARISDALTKQKGE